MIGYTLVESLKALGVVADWSQAVIGYTGHKFDGNTFEVADWSQAVIGYTLKAGG